MTGPVTASIREAADGEAVEVLVNVTGRGPVIKRMEPQAALELCLRGAEAAARILRRQGRER